MKVDTEFSFDYGGGILGFSVKDGALTLTHGDADAAFAAGYCCPAQVHLGGRNQADHHFSKHTGSSESGSLKFVRAETGEGSLTVFQANERIETVTVYTRVADCCRTRTTVKNISDRPVQLEYVSSFLAMGFMRGRWESDAFVHIPHNYWKAECGWRRYSVRDLGLYRVSDFSAKRIAVANTGTMSTKEFLPMGILEDAARGRFLLWQIESSASWNYEISTMDNALYVAASGPSYAENGWRAELPPGGEFGGCAVTIASGADFNEVFGAITEARRALREGAVLPHAVFFNDYMNCLDTDTTFERELPLIERAAELGCGYYMIDAGWYSDDDWYHNTGEWKESENRYVSGGGLRELTRHIRNKGMIPGLWVEIEVVSIELPFADTLPADWFFTRNGERIADNYRYMLNFGNPEALRYAESVVAGIIETYDVGFIKMDHNINGGTGTDCPPHSEGEGLRRHAEGYTALIRRLKERFPSVLFENCASGGCRMDYGLLPYYDLQSTSDQTEYQRYAPIAANCATAVLPEQSGIWCYPTADSDAEETAFNMVNGILGRMYLAGRPDLMEESCLRLVREAVEINLSLKDVISRGKPFWPSGAALNDDKHICYGLKYGDEIYLSVWCRDCEPFEIGFDRPIKECSVIYPKPLRTDYSAKGNVLTVRPHAVNVARLFRITFGR